MSQTKNTLVEGLQRGNNLRRLSIGGRYRNLSLTTRVVAYGILLALAGVGLFNLGTPLEAGKQLLVFAGLLAAFHIIFQYPALAKAAVVSLLAIVINSTVASAAGVITKDPADAYTVYTTWTIMGILAGAGIFLLTQLMSHSRLWVSLLVSYMTFGVTSTLLMTSTRNAVLSFSVGLGASLLITVLANSIKVNVKFPHALADDKVRASVLKTKSKALKVLEGGTVIGVSPVGHLYMTKFFNLDEPLDVSRGHVKYKGKNMARWLSYELNASKRVLPESNIPYIQFMVVNKELPSHKPQTLRLEKKSGLIPQNYDIVLVEYKDWYKTVTKYLVDNRTLLVKPTKSQLSALKNMK